MENISRSLLHTKVEILDLVQDYIRQLLIKKPSLIQRFKNYDFQLELTDLSIDWFNPNECIFIKFDKPNYSNHKKDDYVRECFILLKEFIYNNDNGEVGTVDLPSKTIYNTQYYFLEINNISPLNNRRVILYYIH